MKPYKIILSGGGTGGHLFPALAIAEEIKLRYPTAEILFVGALGRIEMTKVPAAGFKIIGLWIDGFQRSLSIKNLLFPIKLLFSLAESLFITLAFRPNIVVGTGGYASGPLLFIANALKYPTLIQEQNSYPGITNRLLASRVKKIAVAYADLESFFPESKLVLTGNPIRKKIQQELPESGKAKAHFNLDSNRKTLVVLGGSLGARRINQLIASKLDFFKAKKIQVVWQCGALYYEEYKVLETADVLVKAFVADMEQLYSASDFVISRSGAATLSELCCVGKPALLIPSPNVAENHQMQNAMALVNQNAALVVAENKLDEEFETIFQSLLETSVQESLSVNIRKLAKPEATKHIVDLIEEII